MSKILPRVWGLTKSGKIIIVKSGHPLIKRLIYSRGLLFGFLAIFLALITAFLLVLDQRIPAASSLNFNLSIFILPLLVIAALTYLVINRVIDLYSQREVLSNKLSQSEQSAAQAYERFDAIFQVGRLLVEASDENDVIDIVMKLAIQETKAGGASFVPIDEDGQPHGVVMQGEIPADMLSAWLESLGSNPVRRHCQSCKQLDKPIANCFMLPGPVTGSSSVYCLLINRGDQEFGVLNLILRENTELDPEIKAFLGVLKHQTSLALEGVRLRKREQTALNQLQTIRQKTDLQSSLTSLLMTMMPVLGSDFSLVKLNNETPGEYDYQVSQGMLPAGLEQFITDLENNLTNREKPIIVGEMKFDHGPKQEVLSIASAPVRSPDKAVVGSLVVGVNRQHAFSRRQLLLVEMMAGQVGLTIETHQMMTDIEYQAILQERKRLAREIHDGLAQTLGFLKLQAAQIRNYLTNEDYPRARRALDIYYQALNEAYQDVRQSIDGLRVAITEYNFKEIIIQMLANFEDISGLPSSIRRFDSSYEFKPEVQTQVIRIIQETLSNVRKHARASTVWIDCFERDDDFWLEINDDGVGFSPEDIANPSRHGLRGIRERADLIGADFQIISMPGKGTTIRLRYPTRIKHQQETLT